ncbi:MAG: vWA domain-containing protein, partial [Cyclobacteriaceae bacterium]
AHVVSFCRYLREYNFSLGPTEEADVLQALSLISFTDPETFQMILKGVLARSQKEQQKFDDLYDDYWSQYFKAVDGKIKDGKAEDQANLKSNSKRKAPSLQALKSWLYGKGSTEETEIATYSGWEVLTQKDFAAYTADELEEMMRFLQQLARSLASKRQRRYRPSRHQATFDLRRTLRLSMRRGGEILDLAFREPKQTKLQLVLLCDVSQSMDLYSRFLVQFAYAFQQSYRRIETFVFSTSLHRITEEMQEQDYDLALQHLSEKVSNWSGGTKIGASLQQFVNNYRQYLDRRTLVLILSDGWDTGDLEVLEKSMRTLHRKSSRVIWLNPLAGNPDYEPTVKGMQVALPYIDAFAAAHNLESLKSVFKKMQKSKRRSYRNMLPSPL